MTGWQALLLGAAVGGAGMAAYAVFVEPERLELKRSAVPLDSVGPELAGLQIMHLTDLHGRHAVGGRTLCEWSQQLDPDLVAITGDILDPGDEPGPLLAELERLVGNWPVYYVTGNHEHQLEQRTVLSEAAFASLEELLLALQLCGVRVLADSCETVTFAKKGGAPGTICVAGVRDPSLGYANLDRALSGVADRSHPLVLLAHSPDIAPEAESKGVDLILSGHTHGGQICLPGLGAIITRTRLGRGYASGLHRFGKMWLYVNRGIGMTALPVRFLCRPEIALLELRPACGPAAR